MSSHDLFARPICRAEELGAAIPANPHAVSVALPLWDHVVGYEEKRPAVMERIHLGYPRFVTHAIVQELAVHLGQGCPCLPFPSRRTAEACAAFINRSAGEPSELVTAGVVTAVITTPNGAAALKAFWQHAGVLVSSRQAEAQLAGRGDDPEAVAIRRSLRRQLARLYECAEEDVFLQPTGMAAQYAALRALRRRAPGLPTVQLGFPYVDTLKLQQKLGDGAVLLPVQARVPSELESLTSHQPLAGAFAEFPGNPLLGTPDLALVGPILRRHGIPLVADDVVATPFNLNLNGYADLIATSLTKFIVGTGDAMGGALICNPRSPFYEHLKPRVLAEHEELFWGADAAVVEKQARTFPERMREHNRNGLLLAERLRAHPAVERVWYPKWESAEAYEMLRRSEGGYGALLSFLPRRPEATAARVYDLLRVCKGPSLGTVFTLACPFTILAHYTELDWAESCGVSRHLIRLSVGLEDPEELWSRLEEALAVVDAG